MSGAHFEVTPMMLGENGWYHYDEDTDIFATEAEARAEASKLVADTSWGRRKVVIKKNEQVAHFYTEDCAA